MFNNSKDPKRDQVETSNAALTTIAKGTVLEGNIETFGQIRIEGKVTGYIKTQSRLVLGDSSVIEGNTFSQNAEIGGEVRGTVQVSDVLVLKSTAVIHGDIVTGKLVVEAGAIWNGNCKMGNAKDKASDHVLKETHVPKDLRAGEVLNGKAEEQKQPVK